MTSSAAPAPASLPWPSLFCLLLAVASTEQARVYLAFLGTLVVAIGCEVVDRLKG